ncbi:MAG: hypothetical protein ACP5H3_00775 [Candidatus Aenigmatarchaeota archaeon]|jgi:hypothetical protein
MKKLLITLPEYDDETYYISYWSKPIIEEAKRKGIKVLELNRERVNRETVLNFIAAHQPKFLVLNGHGDESSIYGFNNEKIIKEEEDEVFLKDKIIYTIACEAAKSLGKSSVEKGASCFIGYEKMFVFYSDERYFSRPLSDRIASSFFNPTNKIPISIIKGNSTKESIERARTEFKKEISKWRISKELEAPFIIFALIWDLSSLVHLGKDSRFE